MAYEEISIAVNFLVGFGTILLAIIAYKNIEITRNQLKSFLKQTNIFLSQNQPILTVEKFLFQGNRLLIDLTNLGSRPAFEIGCSTEWRMVKKIQNKEEMERRYKSKWPTVTKEHIKDYFDPEHDQWFNFTETVPFRETEFRVEPITGITFLKRDSGETVLANNELNVRFQCEPRIGFSTLSDGDQIQFSTGPNAAISNYQNWNRNFDEIKGILKENGIRYIYLGFSLWSKDPLENPIFYREITYCIVDFEEDASIEDAIAKPRKLITYMLSYPRFVAEIGWQPLLEFKNTKWRSYTKEEEDKERRMGLLISVKKGMHSIYKGRGFR